MEATKITDSTNSDSDINIHGWFEKHIQTLRTHELMLVTQVATKEQTDFYNALMSNDESKINSLTRIQSSIYFIKNIINDYIISLKKRACKPLFLALDISDAKVLVWAKVNEYDDNNHDSLLLSEAEVNAKYQKYGFYITSTIIEAIDNIPTPSHYQNLQFS